MSSKKKINIAVAGATGFVGLDLINILSKHPNVNLKYLCAQKNLGKNIQKFDKRIKKKLPKISKLNLVDWNSVDLLFTSLPTGEAQILIKKLYKYKNLKFIDLSADFRIQNKNNFKKFYGFNHKANNLIKDAVYAITEFSKNKIKKAKIISCPGCYPTSIQLPLIPLMKKKLVDCKNMIIDSKSGYSGAGKNLTKKFKHRYLYESIHPYGIYNHRHLSELNQEFFNIVKKKFDYSFTPHLIPTFRGLVSCIYLNKKKGISSRRIHSELKKTFSKNIFIKIATFNKNIGTENVLNTNFCEISVCNLKINKKVLIISAIDNLIKGASGQAVQNMNILFNFTESTGLK